MAFLEVTDLVRIFPGPVAALQGVNVSLDKGDWLAVMGPSGSGKSTLLNILAALDRPTEGTVTLEGREISRLRPEAQVTYRREQIGLVFQQFHLIPYLTALENVALAQYYHSLPDWSEAAAALDRVGLADRARHLPAALSGGEQQRVCIARALINRPALLLADEPTGNLDEENEQRVLALLEELHGAGHTIITVTHDLAVGRRATRYLQLDHGRVIGHFLTGAEGREELDDLLEDLWTDLEEAGEPIERGHQHAVHAHTLILPQARVQGYVTGENGEIALTPAGRQRARDVVRRHRLAEELFYKTFQMPLAEIGEQACQFEHTLTGEMTESICRFLRHPTTCPHGRPIPAGDCCAAPDPARAGPGEESPAP